MIYPRGYAAGVSIRGVPLVQMHPGQVFWVGNSTLFPAGCVGGNDTTGSGSFNKPWATVEYALSRCTAGTGDMILVKPGHAETLTSAGAITVDVAGVAIVGLGSGTSRPTFTMTTSDLSRIQVTADNVTLHNLLFVAGFLNTAVAVEALAHYLTISNCEAKDTSSILNFLALVATEGETANVAHGLRVIGCTMVGLSTLSKNLAATGGAHDSWLIADNYVRLAVNADTPALLNGNAGDLTNLRIHGNRAYRLNTTTVGGAMFNTTSVLGTGMLWDNYMRGGDISAALLVRDGCLMGMFNNLYTGDVDSSAYVLPAIYDDAP